MAESRGSFGNSSYLSSEGDVSRESKIKKIFNWKKEKKDTDNENYEVVGVKDRKLSYLIPLRYRESIQEVQALEHMGSDNPD